MTHFFMFFKVNLFI